jgi:hypothetical protein
MTGSGRMSAGANLRQPGYVVTWLSQEGIARGVCRLSAIIYKMHKMTESDIKIFGRFPCYVSLDHNGTIEFETISQCFLFTGMDGMVRRR